MHKNTKEDRKNKSGRGACSIPSFLCFLCLFVAKTLPGLALLLLAATSIRANVSLPDVISSGMVLQQKQKVLIWGHADPGETVTVHFAGQSKKATAAPDGKWLVKLDPLRANSTPQTLIISGKNTIELTNILVGEVWLVAGQSNMQRLLSETDNGAAAIAAAAVKASLLRRNPF